MKQFVLVWHNGAKAFPIIQGKVQICQSKRSALKNQAQYKKGKLILRTLAGYLKYPNWQPIKQLTKSGGNKTQK